MKKIFIIVITFTFLSIARGQEGVDYFPLPLDKELEKTFGIQEPILKEIPTKNINGKFFLLKPMNNALSVKYIYIGRVTTVNELEYFDYFIIYDTACSVLTVKVYNYQSAHGYGITSDGWLQQFTGFDGSDTLKVEKNIDGISGATISSHAITSDIQKKTRMLRKIVQKEK